MEWSDGMKEERRRRKLPVGLMWFHRHLDGISLDSGHTDLDSLTFDRYQSEY